MGIQNPILYFPQMTVWTTKVQFRCFWTDLNNSFLFYLEIRWGYQIWYRTFPKWLSGPQKSNFLFYGPIWIIFFLFDFDGDSKSDILNFVFMNVVILVKICWGVQSKVLLTKTIYQPNKPLPSLKNENKGGYFFLFLMLILW